GTDARRLDLPVLVAAVLGEPEVAVRASRDRAWAALGADAGAVFGDRRGRSTGSRREQQRPQRHRHQPASARTHANLPSRRRNRTVATRMSAGGAGCTQPRGQGGKPEETTANLTHRKAPVQPSTGRQRRLSGSKVNSSM